MAGRYWDKFTQQRISRRRALQGVGVAGAAAGAIWIVGCGSDDDNGNGNGTPTNGTPDAGETPSNGEQPTGLRITNEKNPPVQGGRFGISTGADFGTWDAHISVAASANFFPRIYNLLLNQSTTTPDFFYFDLAESYENPDELTWNFKIRPDVMVGPNDLGVPERALTAEDAAVSFQRIKDEPQAGNGAIKPFLDTVGANGDIFTINTTTPYSYLVYRVGIFTSTIPPRELVDSDAGIAMMRDKSAGGGPFRLTSSTEGEVARMDRNPSYYRRDENNDNAQLPYWDGMDLRIIRDRSAVRTAFLDGQLLTYSPETKAEADGLANDNRFFVNTGPATTFIGFTMNPERAPFTDERVRKAVGYAINRQQYVDVVYQGDAEANGLVHWPTGAFAFRGEELNEIQPFDLAEAKALVEAVGGIRFTMMYPAASNIQQHDKHLPIFLEQMRAAGIQVDQDPKDFGTWYADYQTLNYASSLSLNQSYENAEVPLDFHAPGGPLSDRSFAIGLDDPEIEAAIAATKASFDIEEQIELVREAQRLIYAKGPTFLPLVTPFAYTAYNRRVHNVATGLGPATNAMVNTAAWIEV